MRKDSSYGWLVVCATFIVGFITDGMLFSFGILLIDLLDAFHQGRAPTVIIASIITGVMHLIGPVTGLLSDKFGCRAVVIAGSLISFLGFFMTVFVDKLFYMYITYGLLGGVGFGLMYIPASVCVIQHFDKQRALANGISMCGSGVGSFAFTQITGKLLELYGWRGTILIQSGILLNGIVCGLILVSPETTTSITEEYSDFMTDIQTFSGETTARNSEKSYGIQEEDIATKLFLDEQSVKISEESTTIQKATMAIECNHINHNSSTDEFHTEKNDGQHSSCGPVWRYLCDVSLLKNGKLLAFLLSGFCVNLGFTIPFNFIPDQAVELGMAKYQAYWLASSIGISNTVSRIMIGWIADRKFVNRMVLLECLLVFNGVVTCLSVLLTSFETKMIYTCVFGFLMGGYVALCPVVLADLFGVDVIARSFGLFMFAVGITGVIASPIAGWLYDHTGSYVISFVTAGIEFILGACALLIPVLIECISHRIHVRKSRVMGPRDTLFPNSNAF